MSRAPVAVAGADLSCRTKLRLQGADRLRFLNGQVSNDVRLASATASIYTCVMTIKGKMCADAFIHSTADALLLDAEPEVRKSIAARLERYIIADDVTLDDLSDNIGLLHLWPVGSEESGPEVSIAGLRSVRSWRYGQMGLDIFGPLDAIRQARAELAADVQFLAAAELEARRILAGVPKWGSELDENTMPAEAGLEQRAVSYAKGCYIGQEVVSRVKSVGHVNRQLCGLRASGTDGLLPAGWRLHGSTDVPGVLREVGRVTSVAPDPADARASIALAFVRRGWDTPGTVLAARPAPSLDTSADLAPAGPDLPREECSAVVCELPFI